MQVHAQRKMSMAQGDTLAEAPRLNGADSDSPRSRSRSAEPAAASGASADQTSAAAVAASKRRWWLRSRLQAHPAVALDVAQARVDSDADAQPVAKPNSKRAAARGMFSFRRTAAQPNGAEPGQGQRSAVNGVRGSTDLDSEGSGVAFARAVDTASKAATGTADTAQRAAPTIVPVVTDAQPAKPVRVRMCTVCMLVSLGVCAMRVLLYVQAQAPRGAVVLGWRGELLLP